jgi:hypothetical protein
MNNVQKTSIFCAPHPMDRVWLGAAAVCAVATITAVALETIFRNHPNIKKWSFPVSIIASLTFCAATVPCLSLSAVATGVTAFFFIVILRLSNIKDGHIRGGLFSLQTRLTASLNTKSVGEFIRECVRKEKPEFIRQLSRFLLGLPQFREIGPHSGLLVFLQEQIADRIVRFNKPHLVDEFFAKTEERAIPLNDFLPKDLVRMVVQMGDLENESGKFRAYAIFNGNIIFDLQRHADPRVQRLAKSIGEPSAESAAKRERIAQQSEDRDSSVASTSSSANSIAEQPENEYLSDALFHPPNFKNVDFGPLLAQLVFTMADQVPETIPEDQYYGF